MIEFDEATQKAIVDLDKLSKRDLKGRAKQLLVALYGLKIKVESQQATITKLEQQMDERDQEMVFVEDKIIFWKHAAVDLQRILDRMMKYAAAEGGPHEED